MPIPLAPLIAAGGAIIGQGLNAASTGANNRKSRKWNEKMYAMQRQDSLSDWAMQNQYNHPSSQMARLREAGLNPNLVYGNGATAEGGQVRGTEVQSWRPEAAQFDLGAAAGSGLAAYYDTQVKQAQIDNLRVQNDVLEAERLSKLAGIDFTKSQTKTSDFKLALEEQLRDISIGQREADYKKTLADTKFTLNQDERATAMNASSIREAAERILRSRAERSKVPYEKREIEARIENLKRDATIKDYEIQLNKAGLSKGDALWLRIIAQLVSGKYGLKNLIPEDIKKGLRGGRDAIGNYYPATP